MKKTGLISILVIVLLAMPCLSAAQMQTVESLFMAAEHVQRGSEYMGLNLFDEAIEEYWEAVNLDFYNVQARQGLGDGYREKKNFSKAIENYEIVLKQQPDNEEIHYLISLSYYDDDQYEKAIAWAGKVLQMNPDMAKAENLIQLSRGKDEETKREYFFLGEKERDVLQQYAQIQQRKENSFIAKLVPGWRMIQTGTPKKKLTGYLLTLGTAGMFAAGYFLRSSGQAAYDEAVIAANNKNREYYDYYVDLGKRRYKTSGYIMDAALALTVLNIVDSFLLKGKIFGGTKQAKPDLPERDRSSQH